VGDLGRPVAQIRRGGRPDRAPASPPVKSLLAVSLAVLALASPALAWKGPPKTSPPTRPGPGAPPPAWIETQARSAWLFYGSYCWKTSCVDMIPPATRPGLPVLTAARGQTVRVHLRFGATSATASLDGHKIPTTLDAKKRTLSWAAARPGILMVVARADGDASYVARLRIR
jgi:hypothetical protein